MASELSRLIEDELKNKGFYKEGKPREREQEQERDDEEAPHQALMGALRVEARVKEHQHQKKILTLKRSICIGGGLLVVIVLWIVLALKSKSAAKAGSGDAQLIITTSLTPTSFSPPPSAPFVDPRPSPPGSPPNTQPVSNMPAPPSLPQSSGDQPDVSHVSQPANNAKDKESVDYDEGDYDDNYPEGITSTEVKDEGDRPLDYEENKMADEPDYDYEFEGAVDGKDDGDDSTGRRLA